MSKLSATVHLEGHGTFGPDDEVPPEVAKLITNPKAWEGGKLPSARRPAKSDEKSDDK